ncbi:MAG: hypothetical protein K6G80_03760 [Treponema sp.]|nr:hypothetical protein [Treponema sp.]
MKKTAFILAGLCILHGLSAETQISASQQKFIKGNIIDKTAAVKESSGTEQPLAEAGLDFVIEYQPLLGDDRDLSALAIASILALPKSSTTDSGYTERIAEKLVTVFTQSKDETVCIAALDKLTPLATELSSGKAVALMNTHLAAAGAEQAEASQITLAVLAALGKLGNSDSFAIVYSIWKNKYWPDHTAEIEKALTALSIRTASDAVKAISAGSVSEAAEYFAVLKKNALNAKNFIAEIAENVLSKTIYTAEGFSGELVELQLSALSVIAESQWTRASKLVIKYFEVARNEYASGVMSESQFTAVIGNIAKLAPPESAVTLSTYLADLNKNAAENAVPAKSVVLAVISALGELGDKTAFDTLLYVTYLSYPEDVIQAAREALARLKW